MTTYIEFFDKNETENICSCLVSPPDRVVLVGNAKKAMEACCQRYHAIMLDRGHDVEFVARTVDRSHPEKVIDALCQIISESDHCVIDLTGGDELYLVAAGMMLQRFPEKQIQMHRISIAGGTVTSYDFDAKTILEGSFPTLSVEENIRVYGGRVVYEDVKDLGTPIWDMNEEFRSDIYTIWKNCRQQGSVWNDLLAVLETAHKHGQMRDDPTLMITPLGELTSIMYERSVSSMQFSAFMMGLYAQGLLASFSMEDGVLALRYKNEQVMKVLTKAGQALEMIVYLYALVAKDKGKPIYEDALVGVKIDWDGDIHLPGEDGTSDFDTENEIDVIMMRRLAPVFVSCKNGFVEVNELFKLDAVANRFGGRYVKKVLIAPAVHREDKRFDAVVKRAEAMDIRVICAEDMPDDATFEKEIKNLWRGQ